MVCLGAGLGFGVGSHALGEGGVEPTESRAVIPETEAGSAVLGVGSSPGTLWLSR